MVGTAGVSLELVTLYETFALKPQSEKLEEALISEADVIFEALTSLTSIVNLTVVSSIVNEKTGTSDKKGLDSVAILNNFMEYLLIEVSHK